MKLALFAIIAALLSVSWVAAAKKECQGPACKHNLDEMHAAEAFFAVFPEHSASDWKRILSEGPQIRADNEENSPVDANRKPDDKDGSPKDAKPKADEWKLPPVALLLLEPLYPARVIVLPERWIAKVRFPALSKRTTFFPPLMNRIRFIIPTSTSFTAAY